ncbi:hypothetical protein GCM10010151_20900 [Actinoallomurus spadix]|uniref:Transposase IS4-like domain-containing protein n=1 Tax=Actinoallomurus spadix TaxID=79912 RepID=A0ABN0WAL4_9ACTN
MDSTINEHISTPPAPVKGEADGDELADSERSATWQALGRSRGGLTTKVHLAVDGRGLPLALVLTPGNVHDATMVEAVMDAVRIPRVGKGRPRTRPDRVLGDKAYSSRAIRAWCRRHGIAATIPERRDQQANRLRRGSKGGRPPVFDAQAPQRRGERLQPAQTVPRRRNPLRQTRHPLPGRTRTRLTHPVAPPTSIVIIVRHGLVPPHGRGRSDRERLAEADVQAVALDDLLEAVRLVRPSRTASTPGSPRCHACRGLRVPAARDSTSLGQNVTQR